ncbi:siderophore-interacting protein [Kiloniella spongiae]|uniref:siderophore-interacting protein n=1 Tax=Kiloniella spongiae TaxID=1489064 RepID=UPI00069BFDA5|nr:siderophore-interacting protein [Kiloniella spongiae]
MFQSSLSLSFPDADQHLEAQVRHIEQHELQAEKHNDNSFSIRSEYGLLRLSATKDQMSLVVETDRDDGLDIMRDFVADYLVEHMPGIKLSDLVWSGNKIVVGTPANFRTMKVVKRVILNEGMLRLTLAGNDLDLFEDGGLHFRLLLPKKPNKKPVWPIRLTSGKVQFPEGQDELHNRVYTARYIRSDQGEMDFDLVRHKGGVAADWAESVSEGTTVGIMGPGGGSYINNNWLLMGGDETALPAISRILERCSPDTKGQVYLSTRKQNYQIDLQKPDGVEISWLQSNGDNELSSAIIDTVLPDDEDIYVWFGGEQNDARKIRKILKFKWKLKSTRFYCAAYWQKI